MPLSTHAKALLDMAYRVGAPRFHELSVEQARRSFQKLQLAFRPVTPAVASTTDIPMARPDGTALVSRLYRPIESLPGDIVPLLIYFHGGGWCVGDVESYDVLCRELANGSGCAVLSVDYRLAPEWPFPAAVEDAIFSLEWAVEYSGQLGIDVDRIALGGDSAGGNLAIVLALEARARRAMPRFMLLIYPSTEIVSDRPSRTRYANGYFLDRETLEWFFRRYLPCGLDGDWRASPMRAASLAGLPPTLLVTAEFDPLTDDCLAFVKRARSDGCDVEHLAVDGVVHGFVTLGRIFPEATRVLTLAAARLRQAMWQDVR